MDGEVQYLTSIAVMLFHQCSLRSWGKKGYNRVQHLVYKCHSWHDSFAFQYIENAGLEHSSFEFSSLQLRWGVVSMVRCCEVWFRLRCRLRCRWCWQAAGCILVTRSCNLVANCPTRVIQHTKWSQMGVKTRRGWGHFEKKTFVNFRANRAEKVLGRL